MKIFRVALISAVLFTVLRLGASAIDVSATSAVLIDADTGEVLYEKNAHTSAQIASTTKIMTALVVLENCSPDEVVTVTAESVGVEGSSMYLKAGEQLTVRELLYGMMLTSGNDAAVALACHTAGSEEGFVKLMNDKAQELGLKNACFKNPHGLTAEGHGCTAYELALITKAAVKSKLFCDIVSTKHLSVAGRFLTNHNKMLELYDGASGVKTGYTRAAGRTLVTFAERDGMRLIAVTLNAPDDWDDHCNMLDYGFNSYKKLLNANAEYAKLNVISGVSDSVGVKPEADYGIMLEAGDELETKVELPGFVYAAVVKGNRAGCVKIYVNSELKAEVGLVYTQSVPQDASQRLSFWEKVKRAWYRANDVTYYNYGMLY